MGGVGVEAGQGGLVVEQLEIGMLLEEGVDPLAVFFRPYAAGAVDEASAGAKEGGGVGEDAVLQLGERGEGGGGLDVARLGAAGEDPAVGAGDVGEDGVEGVGNGIFKVGEPGGAVDG